MTRIAMWSGPRNISTALMRSWGSRPDTVVSDEPFYAAYLKATGFPHPGAAEVMAAHETDPVRIAAYLAGPIPERRTVWYQKQMAHHMLPGMPLDWARTARHCLLIREPRSMLASLSRVLGDVTPEQTGLPQQIELRARLREIEGREIPVVLASDILADPPAMVRALCDVMGVPWDERMLRWEPGPRTTDGVWAPHWYARVYASTGFEPPEGPDLEPGLPPRLEAVYEACRPLFESLAEHRVRPGPKE